jgi:nicotinamidase-related amidase
MKPFDHFGTLLLASLIVCSTAASVHAQGIIETWSSVSAPPPPSVRSISVDPRKTALLVLDVATHTCNRDVRPRCLETLPKVKALLNRARTHNIRIVFSLGLQPIAGTPADLLSDVAIRANEFWVRSGPDKYLGTDLEKILRDGDVRTVIVVGTASHGAVMYTAGGSVFRGFDVILPVDGLSAESIFAEQYTLWHFQNAPRMAAKVTLTSVDRLTFE